MQLLSVLRIGMMGELNLNGLPIPPPIRLWEHQRKVEQKEWKGTRVGRWIVERCFLIWHIYYTHECIAAAVPCTRLVQDWVHQHFIKEGEGLMGPIFPRDHWQLLGGWSSHWHFLMQLPTHVYATDSDQAHWAIHIKQHSKLQSVGQVGKDMGFRGEVKEVRQV